MHRKKFESVLKSVASLFQVLSHPDRIRILSVLHSQEMDVTHLHEALELSQSSVSQHLKLLKMHGLVDEHREGRRIFYHLTIPEIQNIIQAGVELQTKEQMMESEAIALLKEMQVLLSEQQK